MKKCEKFNSEQVTEMRRRYVTEEISQTDLAKDFGCTVKTVWNILHYVRYSDIPPPFNNYPDLLLDATNERKTVKKVSAI